jgi:3-dehydroquinate dehydratase II
MSTPTLYVINGPNLNLLGAREPEIYGRDTLGDIEARVAAKATSLGWTSVFRQSNKEGELVDLIQEARTKAKAVIINAAGYTHTSVAIHDALKALDIPVIEVHLSNPQKREEFRHFSYPALAASGTIAGFGALGYDLAVEAAVNLARTRQ